MEIGRLLTCVWLLLQTHWILRAIASKNLLHQSLSPQLEVEAAKDVSVIHDNREALQRFSGKSRTTRCVQCYENRYGGDSSDYRKRGGWYSRSESPYDHPVDSSLSGREKSSERAYYPYNTYNRERNEDISESGYGFYDKTRDVGNYYQQFGTYGYRGNDFGHTPHSSHDLEPYAYNDYYANTRNKGYQYEPHGSGTYRDYDPGSYYDGFRSKYDYHQRDDTFRGISETDTAGRGYYFASDGESRPQYPSGVPYAYSPLQRTPISKDTAYRPKLHTCGDIQVEICPHDWVPPSIPTITPHHRVPSLSTAKSQVIYSGGHKGSGISVIGTLENYAGWNYANEENEGGAGVATKDLKTVRDQQSSSYRGQSHQNDIQRPVNSVGRRNDNIIGTNGNRKPTASQYNPQAKPSVQRVQQNTM